jgi:large subunit ribosomal protein L18e
MIKVFHMTTPTGPSNVHKRILARKLWKTQRPVWRDVSKRLMTPQKNRVEVSVGAINRICQEGDVIVIPGKILADGDIQKKLTVAYYAISKSAAIKLDAAKIERMTIEELVEKNPSGKRVRIIV